jgi:hypothetical protein
MQQFVAEHVPEHRLDIIERILKNDSCVNIELKPEGDGNFTVTALCPLRQD